jgi:ectoine hydroxylase
LAAPFDRLETDRVLEQLTGALLGKDWSPLYSMVMYSRKGTVGQAWHQDCPPNDAAKYNLNRLVYSRDLSDNTSGKTVVMPGSHRMNDVCVYRNMRYRFSTNSVVEERTAPTG